MEKQLIDVYGKPNDFKLCDECNHINWYENKECISCGSKSFKEIGKDIEKAINDEIKFYICEEGYNFEDALNVYIDV